MIQRAASLATILPKFSTVYDPIAFKDQMMPNFKEVTAEELIDQIKPLEFRGMRLISVDTETFYTGVRANKLPGEVVRRWIKSDSKTIPNDFPFCISMCDGTNAFVVYDTLQNGFKEFKKLEAILMDRSIDKIAHNFGFDLHMIANTKVNMCGRLHDTVDLSKLTRANAFSHALLDIAKELPNGITKFEYMVKSYKDANHITDYRQIPHELMTQYTCADVWNAIYTFVEHYPRLREYEIEDLYELESQMILVTYYMEREGITLDPDYEDELIPELENEANEAERKIYDGAGEVFNINSGQQLYNVLQRMGYGHLVKMSKPTDGMLAKGIVVGNPKLDKLEMDRLEEAGVPIIKDIMTYRKAEKLLNTFARKLYEMKDFNNVVHCNINKIEAKTGRFSISMPSMQNMPRRKDSRVRGAFVAPAGYRLYDFDFKSQESIILVHYSKAAYLMQLLNEGKDIHTAVASIIYSLAYEEVSKALREIAKSVEFAIVYGAGPDKVATMTGLSKEEAAYVMKTFLKNCPEIDSFIKGANSIMKKRHCIKTILGRLVYAEKGREYACVNYVCQGSAADSTKMRMVVIFKFLMANHYLSFMILQVHDSLLQKIHETEKHIIGKLRYLQTERDLFRVPVLVDVAECYPTWKDKKDIEVEATPLTAEEQARMDAFDIWSAGLFGR